jgi:hypothetical protein
MVDGAMIDRDRLREEWRLQALAWVEADDKASRAEEGRSIFLNELINGLIEAGQKKTDAERIARTCDQWKSYCRKMHELRRLANVARVEEKNRDRIYWEQVSHEANSRAERRMG